MNDKRLNLLLRLESCFRLVQTYQENDTAKWPYDPSSVLKEEINHTIIELWRWYPCFSCDKWLTRTGTTSPWCDGHIDESVNLCLHCKRDYLKTEYGMDKLECPECFSLKEGKNGKDNSPG